MNKRLIVCCDGTWNSPEQHHVTNVVRTARAVRPADDEGVPQIAFYDWGIGSYSGKLTGGMLGAGIDKNIQAPYGHATGHSVAGLDRTGYSLLDAVPLRGSGLVLQGAGQSPLAA